MSLVAQAGGAERLRAILVDFYDRVFADVMIGYLFKRANKERLVERELELALAAMGEAVEYRGKDLREAHAPHQIQGGHFERRQQILRETCDAHGLPAEVRDFWLAHNEQLRPLVTKLSGSDCE
jgi:hemoglobin